MNLIFNNGFMTVVQVFSAVMMSLLILMQNQDAGLSSAFGGSGGVYRSRRGVEKLVFQMTIFFAGMFILTSFLSNI